MTPAEAEALLGLEVRTFRFKQTSPAGRDLNFTARQSGMLAEKVAEKMPLCALYEQDGCTPKAWRPECVTAALVKLAQLQAGEIRQLQQSNRMLAARIARLERRHR